MAAKHKINLNGKSKGASRSPEKGVAPPKATAKVFNLVSPIRNEDLTQLAALGAELEINAVLYDSSERQLSQS